MYRWLERLVIEVCVPEADLVTIGQQLLRDPLAVHERAVGGVEIDHQEALSRGLDLGVTAADLGVAQHDGAIAGSTDRDDVVAEWHTVTGGQKERADQKVDAQLDDATTERYSKLVKSMSKETQFLFISHNKIAMEMAEQLIGVTMQEQGVSRIVAVDMEAAVTLAELA